MQARQADEPGKLGTEETGDGRCGELVTLIEIVDEDHG